MNQSEAKEILLSTKLNPTVREALDVLLPDLLNHYNLPNEEWRDIIGYEGFYQVSNRGRVRSFHRGKVKFLKQQRDEYGYMFVGLFRNKMMKNYFVHTLVAKQFIPNPENKREVNHKNGDKSE